MFFVNSQINMIVKLIPVLLIITLKTLRCSLVIDSISQKGIYLSDYCPSMKYCKEGSHVMCMYYDPNRVMSPRCSNAVNITISPDLANQLLDVTNAIRSKVATGKETGKDGVLLPRGYGIFRLKWDNELATFAQVLANQCVLRHDLCRATKRFADPGQATGLVRFSFPDWYPITKSQADSSPGLTDTKLAYAVTQTLKSWYAQKTSVTEQMVKIYPDWSLTPSNQGGRLYLEIIFASTTHMGCGMSAYAEYGYYENQRQATYNSIQVICNYSSRPRKGGRSYPTEAPLPRLGYSPTCGCPPGTTEDSDCLCNEKTTAPSRALPEPTPCPSSDPSEKCEPTLILLPIFTMEDAPPEKLYERVEEIKDPLKNYILERIDNTSTGFQRSRQSQEILDFFDEKERQNLLRHPPPMPHALKTILRQPNAPSNNVAPVAPPIFPPTPPPPPPPPRHSHKSHPHPSSPPPPPSSPPPPPPRIPPPPPPVPPPPLDQSTSDEPRQPETHEVRRHPSPRLPQKHSPVTKKSSIFTRVAQFKLPGRKSMASPFEVIKKDVSPRRDFSNLDKVVNDYLKHREKYRRKEEHNEENQPHEERNLQTEEKPHTEEAKTETGLNRAEEKVINFNQYLKQKNNSSNNGKDADVKDDNDNKLMSLLDTLEQEVKHIALDVSEKEIFDAKIRKIYGTLVGKPADLTSPKSMIDYDLEAAEIDIGEIKSNGKHEPDHEEEKIPEDPKQPTQLREIENKIGRGKNYEYLVHKRKDFNDHFDLKKFNKIIDHNVFSDVDRRHNDVYDGKYNDNFDHKYSDIEHKYMDDLDRKYNENLDRKYSENNLDRRYNDVVHKYTDNFDQKYHYNLDQKYDDNIPATRNLINYEPNKDILEYRELKHNSLNSVEDIKYRNFLKYSDKDLKLAHSTPDRALYRYKDGENKHRNRIDAKGIKSLHSYNDLTDLLSLERRKYYQEKLDNVERKLRSRNNRRKNDPRYDRSMRRMRPNREVMPRARPKSQADNFYMPERARFLHGF